jgi:hypothetical protein
MTLFHWLKDAYEAGLGLRWSHDDKFALLTLVQGMYAADGHISDDERRQWSHIAHCLGMPSVPPVTSPQAEPLRTAVERLAKDPTKLDAAYHWIAEAAFGDADAPEAADLDAAELAYIDMLVEHCGLERGRIEAALAASRTARVEAILAIFEKQIEGTDL